MPKQKKEELEDIVLEPVVDKVKEPAPVEEPEENIEEPETVEEDAGEEITEPVEFEEPVEGEEGEDVEFDEDAEPEEETGDEESDEGDEPAPFLGLMMSGAKNAPVSEDPDPQSRIEALLWHIIEGTTTDEEPQSRNEAILTAIANSTEYDEDPQSRIEAFLIAILNHEEINIEPISRNEAILKAIANSGEYDKEPQSRNEELLLKWLDAWGVVIATVGPAAIASFYTSLALPLVSLKASIVATESGSGTKSPQNPYTFGGFSNAVITKSGVNLWDEEWESGGLRSTDGTTTTDANRVRSKNLIPIKSGLAYYFKMPANATLYFYKNDGSYINYTAIGSNVAYTIPSGVSYIKFVMGSSTTPVTSITTGEVSINYPSTATTYEPYTATAITLALGQTVYGGEIVLTKKASGYSVKLRGTHLAKQFNDNNLTWNYQSANTRFYCSSLASVIKKASTSSDLPDGFNCECYNAHSFSGMDDLDISIATSGNIFVKDSNYTDVTTWLNAIGNKLIIYPLETPIEIDLTDASDIVALVGTNNVWADTGDMEVSYKKKQTD